MSDHDPFAGARRPEPGEEEGLVRAALEANKQAALRPGPITFHPDPMPMQMRLACLQLAVQGVETGKLAETDDVCAVAREFWRFVETGEGPPIDEAAPAD